MRCGNRQKLLQWVEASLKLTVEQRELNLCTNESKFEVFGSKRKTYVWFLYDEKDPIIYYPGSISGVKVIILIKELIGWP